MFILLLNRKIFQVEPDDVVFLASPYTFDPFIVQMFVAFAAGARLVMVPDAVKVVPSKLCEILFDEEKVTIFQVDNMYTYCITFYKINVNLTCSMTTHFG